MRNKPKIAALLLLKGARNDFITKNVIVLDKT